MLSNQKSGIFGALSNNQIPVSGAFSTDVVIDNCEEITAYFSHTSCPIQFGVQKLTTYVDPFATSVVLNVQGDGSDASTYATSQVEAGLVYHTVDAQVGGTVIDLNWFNATVSWAPSATRDVAKGADFTMELYVKKSAVGSGVGTIACYCDSAGNPIFRLLSENDRVILRTAFFADIDIAPLTADVWRAVAVTRVSNVLYCLFQGEPYRVFSGEGVDFALQGGYWTLGPSQVPSAVDYNQCCVSFIHKYRLTIGKGRYGVYGFTPTFAAYPGYQTDATKNTFRITGTITIPATEAADVIIDAYNADYNSKIAQRRYPLLPATPNEHASLFHSFGTPKLWVSTEYSSQSGTGVQGPTGWGTGMTLLRDMVAGQKYVPSYGESPFFFKTLPSGKKVAVIGAKSVNGAIGCRNIEGEYAYTFINAGNNRNPTSYHWTGNQIAKRTNEITFVFVGYYSGYDDTFFPEKYAPQPVCDLVMINSSGGITYNTPNTLSFRANRSGPITAQIVPLESASVKELGTFSGPNKIFTMCLRGKSDRLTVSLDGGPEVVFNDVFTWTGFSTSFMQSISGNSLGGFIEMFGWDNYFDDASFSKLVNYVKARFSDDLPVELSALSVTEGLLSQPYVGEFVASNATDSTTVKPNAGMLSDWKIEEETGANLGSGKKKYTVRGTIPGFPTTADFPVLAQKAKSGANPSNANLRITGDPFDPSYAIKDYSFAAIPKAGGDCLIKFGDSPFPGTGALVFDELNTTSRLRYFKSNGWNIEANEFTLQGFVKRSAPLTRTSFRNNLFMLKADDTDQFIQVAVQADDAYSVYTNMDQYGTSIQRQIYVKEPTGTVYREWDYLRLTAKNGRMVLTINGKVAGVANLPGAFIGSARNVVIGDIAPYTELYGGQLAGQLLFKDFEFYPEALSDGNHSVPTTPVCFPAYSLLDFYHENTILKLSGNDDTFVDTSYAKQTIRKEGVVTSVVCPYDPNFKHYYFNGDGGYLTVAPFAVKDANGYIAGAKYLPSKNVTVEFEFVPVYDITHTTNNGLDLSGEPGCLMQFGNDSNDYFGLFVGYDATKSQFKLYLKWSNASSAAEVFTYVKPNEVSTVRLRLESGVAYFIVNGKSAFNVVASSIFARAKLYDNLSNRITFGARLLDTDGATRMPVASDPGNFLGYIRNIVITNDVRKVGDLRKPQRIQATGGVFLDASPNADKTYVYLPYDNPAKLDTDVGKYSTQSTDTALTTTNFAPGVSSGKYPYIAGRSYKYMSGQPKTIKSAGLFDGLNAGFTLNGFSVMAKYKPDPNVATMVSPGKMRTVLWELGGANAGRNNTSFSDDFVVGLALEQKANTISDANIGYLVLYCVYLDTQSGSYVTENLFGEYSNPTLAAIPVEVNPKKKCLDGNPVAPDDDYGWFEVGVHFGPGVFITVNGQRVQLGATSDLVHYTYGTRASYSISTKLLDILATPAFQQLTIGGTLLYWANIDNGDAYTTRHYFGGIQDFTVSQQSAGYPQCQAPRALGMSLLQKSFGQPNVSEKTFKIDATRLAVNFGELSNTTAIVGQPFSTQLSISGAASAAVTAGAGTGWDIAAPVDGSGVWTISGNAGPALANFKLKVDATVGRVGYDPTFESVFRQYPFNADLAPTASGLQFQDQSRYGYHLTDLPGFLDDSVKVFGKPMLAWQALGAGPIISDEISEFSSATVSIYDNSYDMDIEAHVSVETSFSYYGNNVLFSALTKYEIEAGAFTTGLVIRATSDPDGDRVAVYMYAASQNAFLLGPVIRDTGVHHIRLSRKNYVYELIVDGVVVDRRYYDGEVAHIQSTARLLSIGAVNDKFYGHIANFRWTIGSVRETAAAPTTVFYDDWVPSDPLYNHVGLYYPFSKTGPAATNTVTWYDESKYGMHLQNVRGKQDDTVTLFGAPTFKLQPQWIDPIYIYNYSGIFNQGRRAWSLEWHMLAGVAQAQSDPILFSCTTAPTHSPRSVDGWWVGLATDGSGVSFGVGNISASAILTGKFPTDKLGEMVHVKVGRVGGDLYIRINGVEVATVRNTTEVRTQDAGIFIIGGNLAVSNSMADGNIGMLRYTLDATRDEELPTRAYPGLRASGSVFANIKGYEVLPSDCLPVTKRRNHTRLKDHSGNRNVIPLVSGNRTTSPAYNGQYGVSTVQRSNSDCAIKLEDERTLADFSRANFIIDCVVAYNQATVAVDGELGGCIYHHGAYNELGNGNADAGFNLYAVDNLNSGGISLYSYIANANESPILTGPQLGDNLPHRITIQRNGAELKMWIDGSLVDSAIYEKDMAFRELSDFGVFGDSYSGFTPRRLLATWYFARVWHGSAPFSGNAFDPSLSMTDMLTETIDTAVPRPLDIHYWDAISIFAFDCTDNVPHVYDYRTDEFELKEYGIVHGGATTKTSMPAVVNTSADRLSAPMANSSLLPKSGTAVMEFDGLTGYVDFSVNNLVLTQNEMGVPIEDSDPPNANVFAANEAFTFEWISNQYSNQGVWWECDAGIYLEDGYLKHRSNSFSPIELHPNLSSYYRKLVHWVICKNTSGDIVVWRDGIILGVFSFGAAVTWNTVRFGASIAGDKFAYGALDGFRLSRGQLYSGNFTPLSAIPKSAHVPEVVTITMSAP